MTSLETAQSNLKEAELRMEQVKAEHDAQQREAVKAKLEGVRKALREAHAHYGKNAPIVIAQRQARMEKQLEIQAANLEVSYVLGKKPRIADVLPDDPEAAEWSKEHARAVAARDKLVAEFDALPNPDVPGGLAYQLGAYEGPYGTIATLQYAENNLIAAIKGESSKSWLK